MDASFPSASPRPPPDASAQAPARVNLIGEHTDYCEGFVLPLPLSLQAHVELRRRPDSTVEVRPGLPFGPEASYQLGRETPGRGWLDYIQGVTFALERAGFALGGVTLDIASDIPPGAGLASSAALCLAVLRALRQAFGLPLDSVALARLAQEAETDFVGAPVGLMDQLAASLGVPGVALFLDMRTLGRESLPLPADVEVGVLHSGITHHNASGTYGQRREEAHAAAAALGVPSLRDVGETDLERIQRLPAPLDRRARHVVTENARVLAFAAALRAGMSGALGPLLDASHRSLRDDYAVSHPDVDKLVALAAAAPGVLGARMTGGGCGGAVLFLCPVGQARATGTQVAARYREETGQPGTFLVVGGSSRPVD
jgi:galactokinase